MPSVNPRPSLSSKLPPKSSGGPYIAAIVVLVLLIVGLVWYKLSRKDPIPPTPVIQSVSSVTTTPPPMIDIPPPPELDAGPEAGPDAGKKRGPGGGNRCAGPCNADAPAALRSKLSGTAGAARGCYERALRTNPMLQGKMLVSIRVASNGSVCSVGISSDGVGSPNVRSCVRQLFSGKSFPPPTGGKCADVNVPLSFMPREEKKKK